MLISDTEPLACAKADAFTTVDDRPRANANSVPRNLVSKRFKWNRPEENWLRSEELNRLVRSFEGSQTSFENEIRRNQFHDQSLIDGRSVGTAGEFQANVDQMLAHLRRNGWGDAGRAGYTRVENRSQSAPKRPVSRQTKSMFADGPLEARLSQGE